MKLPLRVFFFFVFSILIAPVIVPIAAGSSPIRGVSPEDEKHYDSGGVIRCKDGSKKFTRDQLNDDFCDCPDSTDEPGTSACPNGKFYCHNAGHAPLYIFSSRVNDGICDCCDGSDEYNGKVQCTNTCWEAGKVARNRLRKKIETYKEGLSLRTQEVEQARLSLAMDEAELSKLKHEEKILKGLVQQLKDRKEQIDKAEEKERLQKEKEEKEKKEAEEKENQEKSEERTEAEEKIEQQEEKTTEIPSKAEKDFNQERSEAEKKIEQQEEKTMESTDNDKIGLLEDSPLVQDATEHYDDSAVEAEHDDHSGNEEPLKNSVIQGQDESENTEELSREELGRRVASRWTGENTEQQTAKGDALKVDDREDHEETREETRDEEEDGYASETDDDRSYDDDTEDHTQDIEEDHDDTTSSYKSDSENDLDSPDITFSSDQTWLEKIQQTVRNILQAVNFFQTPVDKSDAARVRKEYDESSAKLSKMQSRISSLTRKLEHDFGPDKEFYSFYGRCFESKQNKYVYKVCPFKQASQVEGHSITKLGQWEKFEDSYKSMLFSDGDKCWNGPDRSLKVKLRCGLKNEVTDVDEPSRCEYVALLSTPNVCVEEKLKELQQKLDLLNNEQPHDEL